MKNPITHRNGLPVNLQPRPCKFVAVYKRNQKGQYIMRDGKLILDHSKSRWIYDPHFKRKYGRSPLPKKSNIFKRKDDSGVEVSVQGFQLPEHKPTSSNRNPDFLDVCTSEEYFVLTGHYRNNSKEHKSLLKRLAQKIGLTS